MLLFHEFFKASFLWFHIVSVSGHVSSSVIFLLKIPGKFIKVCMYLEQNHFGFLTKLFDRFIESSFSCDFPINQDCKIFLSELLWLCFYQWAYLLALWLACFGFACFKVDDKVKKIIWFGFEKKAFKKGKQI